MTITAVATAEPPEGRREAYARLARALRAALSLSRRHG